MKTTQAAGVSANDLIKIDDCVSIIDDIWRIQLYRNYMLLVKETAWYYKRSDYPVAFVSALSNRSRNRLNDANFSAIPDFPATRGRNSTKAASTPI
jgi:hypothetical protein